MNLVLYACQSRKEDPTIEEQIKQLREYCTNQGHTIASEHTCAVSGGFASALFATDNADGLLVYEAIGSVMTVRGDGDTSGSFARFVQGKAFFSLKGDVTKADLLLRWQSAQQNLQAKVMRNAD